jgi:putative DNA primase/helicase
MRNSVDFKKLHSLALTQAENIVRHFVPNGKLEGREWVGLNPNRPDKSARSFSINIDTGVWADFATHDKGGDLISYVGYVQRCANQGDAYKILANFLGMGDDTIDKASLIHHTPLITEPKPKVSSFTPVLPCPTSAVESCPQITHKHGLATLWWDYKSAKGELLMRVYRFNKPDGGKTFAQVTYGILNERTGWHWKNVPHHRPLYGLDLLAALPMHMPVIVTEGEKAADAAHKLFPDRPSVTWNGGAGAVTKAEFSPLAGRHVWFWPDNDTAGQQTISPLTKALEAVGVAAFRVFDITAFARYSPASNGELLNTAREWPLKADAFDALALGWTAQHLNALELRNELLLPASGDSKNPSSILAYREENSVREIQHPVPYGYKVDDSGVYKYNDKKEKYFRICARLEVVARSRDASKSGDNWGLLVCFKNHDGKEKRINFPMELFGADGGIEITKRLLKMGLDYSPYRESRRNVLDYLLGYTTKERVGLVHKTGWHNNVFVLPDRTIGIGNEPLLFYTEGANLCKLSERGTLDDWKENVSRYCIDNPLALFAVSAAFSAPLVELLGQETMGFHFYGDSSWGKSTLLDMACSVFGKPDDYKKVWRSTDNGMESLAASHSEMLLALDEINQFDPRKLGDVIYMLGNGSGKTRATDRGGARDDLHRWCFTFLSNGEKTLAQYMAETEKNKTAGMEMRFLEIRATLQESEVDIKRMGVFNNPHHLMGGAALSEYLKGTMAQCHGTAFPAFINALVRELEGDKRKQFIAEMLTKLDNFRKKHLTENASGQARRAAMKFALVAWAGEMATLWGITSWRLGHATIAASTCFSSWLSVRGSDGNFEEKQMLDHVRHQISKYGESRFKRWDEPEHGHNTVIDSHVPITAECWGFRRETTEKNILEGDSSDVDFYIYPDAFRKDICKGFDASRIARLLREMGVLVLTESDKKENRLTTKARLPRTGSKGISVYRIRNSALFENDDTRTTDYKSAA